MQGELDELEREEFFRLKKVQDKKQRGTEKTLKDRENTSQPSYTPPAEAISLPPRTSWGISATYEHVGRGRWH